MTNLMKSLIAVALMTASAWSNDELTRSTWEIPTHNQVQMQIDAWLMEIDAPSDVAEQVRLIWTEPVAMQQRLETLVESFTLVDPQTESIVEYCRSLKVETALPAFDVLTDESSVPFVRNNLKLLYARWLAQNELYNEVLDQIEYLETKDVIDPAALLFYKGVAFHHLLRKPECVPVLDKLLEKESELPKRFSMVANLMRADIEPLEVDSLDEISRIMDNIEIRLGHGRAGKRVRKEEEDVISKLDKMIKELEDKQKSGGGGGGVSGGKAGDTANPSQPMQDSMPGGIRGPGNVDAKDVGEKSGWGDLPPKERQRALQQLGKDFPSHYRDVITEYFRKLAREGADR